MRPWSELVGSIPSRVGITADKLPSNHDLPNDVTPESLITGWTVQRPYENKRYPVEIHLCVLCGQQIGPNDLARGVHECRVRAAVGG